MPPQKHRREHERFRAKTKTALVLLDAASGERAIIEGTIVDLGEGGACVAVSKMINAGSVGVMKFALGGRPIVKGIETRSVRYEPKRGHLVGLRFWNTPPNAKLDRLLRQVKDASREDAPKKDAA